jgi:predicted small lipoprotein YifL
MPKTLITTAIFALALLLAGCGVRGPLEKPGTTATEEGHGKSAAAGDAGKDSAAQPKPHEPFVLDGLLR